MRSPQNPLDQEHSLNPWISIISLILMVFGIGALVINFSVFLLAPFGVDSLKELTDNIRMDMPENYRTALLIFQGTASFGGFILAPLIFIYLVAKVRPADFIRGAKLNPALIAITSIIVILFMIVNAPIIEWNANLSLPEAFSEVEDSARAMEDTLAEQTMAMTTFDNFGQFLLALFVIAVIPALGEELLFRGLLQNYILKISGNHHIAIWLIAIGFGVFHMQFFGVVPRILLGALFGYLYVWTGNLWVPILAHFVNNGFTILMTYLYQQDGVGFDIQDTSTPPVFMVAASFLLLIGLIIYLRRTFFINIDE